MERTAYSWARAGAGPFPQARRDRRRPAAAWLYLALVIAVSAAAVSPARAMRAELWERWTAQDPGAAAQLNQIAWDYLLDTYLRRAGTAQLFDYRGVTPRDRLLLDQYVESLAGVPISRYARPEQLAFWINLYNAVTVKMVLDAYPIGSIRQVDSLFRLGGLWDEKRLTVEGEKLSLDDIAHRILRPIWRDPRGRSIAPPKDAPTLPPSLSRPRTPKPFSMPVRAPISTMGAAFASETATSSSPVSSSGTARILAEAMPASWPI